MTFGKNIKHLFFDLDHTLWDFEGNSAATLSELYDEFHLNTLTATSCQEFIRIFHHYNNKLWTELAEKKWTPHQLREQRLQLTFRHMHVPLVAIPKAFNDTYLSRCPTGDRLMTGAKELLEWAAPRYDLHIITNGYDDIQKIKLKSSGLDKYFRLVITPEKTGYRKPEKGIFAAALKGAKASHTESLMIGDCYHSDVTGGKNAAMYTAWVTHKKVQHDVHTLADIVVKDMAVLHNILEKA